MSLCCEVISSFVIFAVLDLRVGGCRFRRWKLLSLFTLIFAVFLHDLVSSYQISSKRNHSRQSYDVISISKILKIAAIWSWKSIPGNGFSNSTRLAMFKSIHIHIHIIRVKESGWQTATRVHGAKIDSKWSHKTQKSQLKLITVSVDKQSLMCADFRINCLSCWRARRLWLLIIFFSGSNGWSRPTCNSLRSTRSNNDWSVAANSSLIFGVSSAQYP